MVLADDNFATIVAVCLSFAIILFILFFVFLVLLRNEDLS